MIAQESHINAPLTSKCAWMAEGISAVNGTSIRILDGYYVDDPMAKVTVGVCSVV